VGKALRPERDPHLGVFFRSWLRDPFHVTAHRYTVFVPACWARNDAQRRSLLNLLRSETPAYTQGQIEYVEPRFRIGIQSTVGLNSVVGRYPSGVTLDQSKLGGSSVLSAPPGKASGPATEMIEPLGVKLKGGHTIAVSWVPKETAYTIEVFRQFDCCA